MNPSKQERQSWEALLERLEDQGEKMKGSLVCGSLEHPKVVMDVQRQGAASMYRDNWQGCRDVWKANYRQSKELRSNRSSMK